ncbi:HD domain-containing protein [Roseburia hominis]|nr:HD domain-containing protein [Roseburia hominis]
MKKGIEHEPLIWKILNEIRESSRFKNSKQFIQHGKTSVYMHSVSVAYMSCYIAEKYNLSVDYYSLITGALLHDYFLYDWHDKEDGHKRPHGFYHPSAALANAERDFEINSRIKNIIKRHMFPLTPIPPVCLEGWVVCIADKICSTKETIKRH